MIRRPPRSTQSRSSAASDVYKRQPFGLATKDVFVGLGASYPDTYVDLYACFATRGLQLAGQGIVGAITSRAFLTTKKLVRWRTKEVVPLVQFILDLGSGVMDDAFVESCAYI